MSRSKSSHGSCRSMSRSLMGLGDLTRSLISSKASQTVISNAAEHETGTRFEVLSRITYDKVLLFSYSSSQTPDGIERNVQWSLRAPGGLIHKELIGSRSLD